MANEAGFGKKGNSCVQILTSFNGIKGIFKKDL